MTTQNVQLHQCQVEVILHVIQFNKYAIQENIYWKKFELLKKE